MTTAIANATVFVPIAPKTINYCSVINPYDDEYFATNMKEGMYRWHLNTKTDEGWMKDVIYATVYHSDKILDLFKFNSVQFGLENIMNIPTSWTGAVHATPQTIVVVDHWNADVRYHINILTSYHHMSLYQIHAFYGWFMGN